MAPVPLNMILPFVLYVLLMLSIGILFYHRTRNLSDYILGSRQLGSWVTALSAQASDMSGWLLMGLPGYAYLAGLNAVWIAFGLTVGTFLNWQFVAPKLRRYTESKPGVLTIPGYFESRFPESATQLRVLSAVFILIFFLIYTASGFVAGAKLFSTVFLISYNTALFIAVLVIIIYIFLGGFLAVCWTDFIQGMIMFFAVLIVPVLAVISFGGLNSVMQQIETENMYVLSFFINPEGQSLSAIAIVSLMAWGLGYFGQPHILVRFMAIRKVNLLSKSKIISMIWVVLCLSCAVAIGTVAVAVLKTPLIPIESETVFLVLVRQLVPPLIAGFLMAGVLAAIMSTADSQLLVASSAMTQDLYRLLLRKSADDKELLRISRFAVVVIAVIAYLIARNPDASVLDLVAYAWAGFGAAFGPLMLFSLFWDRMTGKGAMFSILTGGTVVLIWKQLSGGVFDLYEIVPGFLMSGLIIIWTGLFMNSKKNKV